MSSDIFGDLLKFVERNAVTSAEDMECAIMASSISAMLEILEKSGRCTVNLLLVYARHFIIINEVQAQ